MKISVIFLLEKKLIRQRRQKIEEKKALWIIDVDRKI